MTPQNPPIPTPIVVDHEIRFVGMKRSGNHAIQNWILSQAGGDSIYFNNVWPESPFLADPVEPYNDLSTERHGMLLYSLEDRPLPLLSSRRMYPQAKTSQRLEISAKRRTDVLIIRDTLNLFASRLVSGRVRSLSTSGLRLDELCLTYLREAAGVTNHLPFDRIVVDYNRWTTDREYRRTIASGLDLSFTDAGLHDVPVFGGGSTFDGTRFDGNASQMRVHERWTSCADRPEFLALLKNPELLALTQQLFTLTPEAEQFIERLRERRSSVAGLRTVWASARIRVLPPLFIAVRGLRNRLLLRPSRRRVVE